MSNRNLSVLFFLLIALIELLSCRQGPVKKTDPNQLRSSTENIIFTDTANRIIDPVSLGIGHRIITDTIAPGIYHIRLLFTSEKNDCLRSLEIRIPYMPDNPEVWDMVKNSFHWVPNLKQKPGDIIAQHVFRSPCIILTYDENAVSLIPDLNVMKANPALPCFLDLNFGERASSFPMEYQNTR